MLQISPPRGKRCLETENNVFSPHFPSFGRMLKNLKVEHGGESKDLIFLKAIYSLVNFHPSTFLYWCLSISFRAFALSIYFSNSVNKWFRKQFRIDSLGIHFSSVTTEVA